MIYGITKKIDSEGNRWNLEVKIEQLYPADHLLVADRAKDARFELFFWGEVLDSAGSEGLKREAPASGLLRMFRAKGLKAFAEINGAFVVAVLDEGSGELVLARDHLGVEPLYYRLLDGGRVEFSTSLRKLAGDTSFPQALNFQALATYLLLNYNPSGDTLIQGFCKVPPGCGVRFRDQRAQAERYWAPDYSEKLDASVEEIAEALRSELDRAVRLRVSRDRKLGLSVSGGMDSSTVLGLARKYYPDDFFAFSFRCAVESYDESFYSSLVAHHYGAKYEQVEYTPERALAAEEMVRYMDEPQADLGIEVATYLLGQHAQGKVDLLLTGDGGDELFAGHPVYLADRMAGTYEKLPGWARSAIGWMADRIPESQKKSAFSVKLKRFVEGQRFPGALYSNRWRIYYTREMLESLLTRDAWQRLNQAYELDWLKRLYLDLPWSEYLDRALFGDYYTVVQFYLRRLYLLRRFGIQARCPLLDPMLVQFCARIPLEMKIPNSKEQKYIQKKAMEGILPDEIVHRKDKLGHSVPMRKWLREEPVLIQAVRKTLAGDARLVEYGIVRPNAVEAMIREYLAGKRNHSHRIWALYVLELWLRSWER